MQNVLVESGSCGQLLLRCICAYVKLDVLASFDINMDETIAFGQGVADKFIKLANVSHLPKPLGIVIAILHEQQEYDPGNWNFPKMYLIKHLFDDIEAKGVTRNYTSKTFKKMHGPLKDSYDWHTNFKNMGGQVSELH